MSYWVRLGELWAFREVVKNFVARDLKVRYRRSSLGFLWSLLNPMLQLAVLSTVFSVLLRIEGLALYILAGLVPWSFFATSIEGCSTSLVNAESVLRRQYFPKLVFPLSLVLQNLITLGLSLAALLLLLGWFIDFRPTWAMLAIIPACICVSAFALGLGAVLALVTVYFRDMRHLIGVCVSAWFYLTPVLYPLETRALRAERSAPHHVAADVAREPPGRMSPVPEQLRWYFKLNPMYSMVAMFQRPIYYEMWPTRAETCAAVATSGVVLAAGLFVFWRHEDTLIFAL